MPRTPNQRRRPTGLIAVAVATAALVVAPSAHAAVQWNDGTLASSTYTQCVVDIVEMGADAQVGFQGDPANPPRVGEVFYGHAMFAGLTSRCGGDDQIAELDVVLPPGVSLAIDAAHPIRCNYEDGDGPVVPNPTCPTHTVPGAYGPAFPAGDGGSVWDMPPGRTLEVQFPLISTRQLMGGGSCPASVDEIAFHTDYDCLLAAVHVVDGDTDPWLAPDVQVFMQAADQGRDPGAGAKVSLAVPAGQHLRSLKHSRALKVTCTATAAGRCAVSAAITAKQARKLHLAVKQSAKRYTLGSARKRLAKAGHATLRIKLSRKTATALSRAKKLRVTCSATAAGSCRVSAAIAPKQARTLHLAVKKSATQYVLGAAHKLLAKAGGATLRIKLSRKTASALARAKKLRVTLTATDTNGATSRRTVTLKR